MTIEFHCPQCEKLLRTSDEKAGATAKCPQCGHPIEVPQPDDHDQPESDTYGLDNEDQETHEYDDDYDDEYGAVASPPVSARTKPCPMCGEENSVSTRRCEYCGEELGTPSGKLHPTKMDVGDVISTSWEIFKAEMGLCIGGVVLAMAILVGGIIALYVVTIMAMFAAALGPGGIVAAIFILTILLVVLVSIQWYLHLGVANLTFRIARGQAAEIGDLFSVKPYFLRMIGNTLILIIMMIPPYAIGFGCLLAAPAADGSAIQVILGLVAFVAYIGVIAIAFIFWPYTFVLLDQDPPGLDSLWTARRVTSGNHLAIFLLAVVAFFINLIGILPCYVGLLFTIPFTAVMFAVAYCRMTGQRTAY